MDEIAVRSAAAVRLALWDLVTRTAVCCPCYVVPRPRSRRSRRVTICLEGALAQPRLNITALGVKVRSDRSFANSPLLYRKREYAGQTALTAVDHAALWLRRKIGLPPPTDSGQRPLLYLLGSAPCLLLAMRPEGTEGRRRTRLSNCKDAPSLCRVMRALSSRKMPRCRGTIA